MAGTFNSASEDLALSAAERLVYGRTPETSADFQELTHKSVITPQFFRLSQTPILSIFTDTLSARGSN
jgi:hypothetical protein